MDGDLIVLNCIVDLKYQQFGAPLPSIEGQATAIFQLGETSIINENHDDLQKKITSVKKNLTLINNIETYRLAKKKKKKYKDSDFHPLPMVYFDAMCNVLNSSGCNIPMRKLEAVGLHS